jgi:hypothetical protein
MFQCVSLILSGIPSVHELCKWKCIAARQHVTLCAQKLKMRCAHKSDAAAVCAKPKVMSKPIEIYQNNAAIARKRYMVQGEMKVI